MGEEVAVKMSKGVKRGGRKKGKGTPGRQESHPLAKLPYLMSSESLFKMHQRVVLVALLAIALIFGALIFVPKMELWGDNAEFIILARSIVKGLWMRHINQPDAPVSHRYPFGFPLLLAPIEWALPGNLLAMKRFILILFSLSIPVVYLVMRQYASPVVAMAISLLTMGNPILSMFSHQTMSEVPYLLLSLTALWLSRRSEEEAGLSRNYSFWGGVAITIAATCVRIIGVSLFFGTLAFFLIKKAWKKAAALAVAYTVAILLLQLTTGEVIGTTYIGQLGVDPTRLEIGTESLAGLAGRQIQNLRLHAFWNLPMVVYGSPKSLPFLWRPKAFGGIPLCALPLLALFAIGFGSGLFGGSLPALYLLCYAGILLSWPTIWAVPRLLAPVVPLIFLFLAMGVAITLRQLGQRAGLLGREGAKWLGGSMFALALAAGLSGTYFRTVEDLEYSPQWKSYFEAAEWLKQHAPKNSLVLARKPFLLHLASEQLTMRYLSTPDHEALIKHALNHRADFVVVDRLGFSETPQYLVPAIRSYKMLFEPVYVTATRPQTHIFRIRREAFVPKPLPE